MKKENRGLYLKQKQAWWDKQNNQYKDAHTRPGSVKTK